MEIFGEACGRALCGGLLLAVVACSGGARVEPVAAVPVPSASASTVSEAPPRVKPRLISENGQTCQLRSDGAVGCWGWSLSDWAVGPTWVAGLEATEIAFIGRALAVRERGGGVRVLPPKTRPDRVESFTPRPGLSSLEIACEGERCCWLDDGGVLCGPSPLVERRPGEDGEPTPPARVEGITGATAVVIGVAHACALTAAGEVHCWGSNQNGQIGAGLGGREKFPPTRVAGLDHVVQIVAENRATCARTESGEIHCWGDNSYGVLDAPDRQRATPLRIKGLPAVVDVSLSWSHACAVGADGEVYCWGTSTDGELGNGHVIPPVMPVVKAREIKDIQAVSAEWRRTCALGRDESAWCWGLRVQGQLGDGQASEEHSAVEVQHVAGAGQLCIRREIYPPHPCVIDANHGLLCWGPFGPLQQVRSGVLGCDAGCLVLQDGTIHCGNSSVEQVKDAVAVSGWCGLRKDRSVACWPVGYQVKPNEILKDATAVRSGHSVGCALKGAGELWCWGEVARYGSTKSPIHVTGPDDVVEIELDNAIQIGSGLLRRRSGSVEWWYWAMTSLEQNRLDLRTRPLEGVTSAVSLAGGAEEGCVVLADGHVRCWGHNSHGELGNGTTSEGVVREPALVQGIDDAVSAAIGPDFRCALRRGGTVKCWGNNVNEQLGKPFRKVQPTPVRVRETRPRP